MARTIPRVQGGMLVPADPHAGRSITVGTPDWYAWLDEATAFSFAGEAGRFTARKERFQRGGWYWKAYRRQGGRLRRVYLGKSGDLTPVRLNAAATTLAGRPTGAQEAGDAGAAAGGELAGLRGVAAHVVALPDDPLLATKLRAPLGRRNLIPRPHLAERLHVVTEHKLTLVAAPAGFGKTTVLSEWVRHAAPPDAVGWVSLDAGDNDPVRFWGYAIGALDRLRPGAGTGARALLRSAKRSLETVLIALLNRLAREADDLVLVLDDYHVVETPEIHTSLTYLVDHLPPRLHLVIASRADPPLPLARLRARGELAELRAADLRFTPAEAGAFLRDVMGLDLPLDTAAALADRTEGWIVGLHLAGLALRGRADAAGFLAAFSGSHHYVVDYLAGEVLQRLPPELYDFLLRTSFLDRLCGPLGEAVTDREGGRAMLEALERANLFLVSLDEERRWYRYHHLFADVLRHRLQQEQPGQMPELHRRAAAWFARHGLAEEALRHALAAPDLESAARLVEEHGRAMLRRGEVDTLVRCLDALPEDVVRARPPLGVLRAWALLITGRWDALEACLQDVERTVQTQARRLPAVRSRGPLGHIAAMRGTVAANRGEAPRAIELSRQALHLLPADELSVRSVVALNLGDARWTSGDVAGASEAYVEAEAIGRASGNVQAALVALYNLARLQAIQGQLRRMAETCRQALRLGADADGHLVPASAAAGIAMGELLRERNDLGGASGSLEAAVEACRRWGSTEMLADGYLALARVRQARGDTDGAQEALTLAEPHVRTGAVHGRTAAEMAATRARLWLARGDVAAAAHWAAAAGLGTDAPPGFLREPEYLALARVLLAQRRHQEALTLLGRLLESAETGGRSGRVLEILALQALALHALGSTDAALGALSRALTLAEPEGYVRLFVDEAPPMAALLELAARHRIVTAYVGRLLAACPNRESPGRPPEIPLPYPAPRPLPSALVEPLTEREVEVLRLVAAGRSNAGVAGELVVALSTVKKHLHNIYGKLDARSRTQALVRARELRLL